MRSDIKIDRNLWWQRPIRGLAKYYAEEVSLEWMNGIHSVTLNAADSTNGPLISRTVTNVSDSVTGPSEGKQCTLPALAPVFVPAR